jgi:hypothetical protein
MIYMTTKKDGGISENNESNDAAKKGGGHHHDEASGSANTEVKNAHATGDGAMGPNDTRLPEVEEDNAEAEDNEVPPY